MKFFTAASIFVFVFLCRFYWSPPPFDNKPTALLPIRNEAFCELHPLTALERELSDFRSDCFHTQFNFSCYTGTSFPKRQSLLQSVGERLSETSRNLGNLPSFLHTPLASISNIALTIPWLPHHHVHPVTPPKNNSSNKTNKYQKIGSTGLPFEAGF